MKQKRKWARYILMLAAALAASAVLGGRIFYGAAAALVLLAPAALLLARISERQLLVRHALDCEHCVRESTVRYAVAARNRGILPSSWVSLQTAASRGLPEGAVVLSLTAFETFRWERDFTPAHRGVYDLSVASVRLSDPFRLLNLRGRTPAPLELTVLPRLIPISETWKQRLDPQGTGGFFSQSSDEPAVDNRQYRYGDSPRRIHWNLTARRRELMVRQYESIESRRLLVALDLSPFTADDPESCEDTLLEACLSVICYALERQIETTLIYAEGDTLRRHTGRDTRAFEAIHRDMARVAFTAHTPVTTLLQDAQDAQMVYLFCVNAPHGDTLAALPPDKPTELAVIRTGTEQSLSSTGSIRVTELVP